MYDFGSHLRIDTTKAKTKEKFIIKGDKYRISVLSDVLIRLEWSESNSFNDFPTAFALNRSFYEPNFTVKEDEKYLSIKNKYFLLEYTKGKPFIATKFLPDANLRVNVVGTEKSWYFNHPEVRNFMGSAYSLDNTNGKIDFKRGLFSVEGFASIDDTKSPILNEYGNLVANKSGNIDVYLFIYNKEFGLGLKDYFSLTGYPPLIPRYALGIWWNKNELYNEQGVQDIVNNFKRSEIPLSVFLLSKWHNKETNYSFDRNILPNPSGLSNYLKTNKIHMGVGINTLNPVTTKDDNYNLLKDSFNITGAFPINVVDSKALDGFLKFIIDPLLKQGVDFFWIDDNNKNEIMRQYFINFYLFNNFNKTRNKRNMIMSRNPGICSHRFSVLYSGDTFVNWKTLKLLPFYNASAANIGISFWSHDIGGFKEGMEDAELYMRYVQLGTYSPILRLSSDEGKYYKREPWKWDVKTEKIVRDYMRVRHRLIPYIYAEAHKYSKIGSPLIQPLYYKYPETYDEPRYKNEFYFGSELFVCPITDPKDEIMNRVVHRIFLPNGIWYDFKTGKKYIGGRRYVTFFKDEDYPVFAKAGAIIPMAILDEENLNDTSSPKKLEIQIFPGRSNTYKLYEDDGVSSMYKDGFFLTSSIDYFYKEDDFSVNIKPIEGKSGVVPEKRDYKIRFRNTKYTEGVQVFADRLRVPFKSYTDDTDFIVEFNNISTISEIFVYCKGKGIEIEAFQVINEDLDSIISDLKIETKLKYEIAKIIFSKIEVKKKRIDIKKLRREGLPTVFIKMFMKLLEYIAEI